MNSNKPKLIVSFHDLAPHSQDACETILNELRECGVERVSLLVTPKWHDGDTIDHHPGFLEWIRQRECEGHEISLHGYTHRAETVRGGMVSQAMGRIYTASEGEFYQISYETAQDCVQKGLAMLQDAGLTVQGFTPPAWLLSPEGRNALIENGLIYSTELQYIDILQKDRRIYAPTLVFSSRSGWRRWTSIRWVKFWERYNRQQPVMRLAVHPIDWHYPAIRQTILDLADHLCEFRTPITYLELAQLYSG